MNSWFSQAKTQEKQLFYLPSTTDASFLFFSKLRTLQTCTWKEESIPYKSWWTWLLLPEMDMGGLQTTMLQTPEAKECVLWTRQVWWSLIFSPLGGLDMFRHRTRSIQEHSSCGPGVDSGRRWPLRRLPEPRPGPMTLGPCLQEYSNWKWF